MKIICNNKVIDLDKFDTVTCRESLVGEGFPIGQLEEKQVDFLEELKKLRKKYAE